MICLSFAKSYLSSVSKSFTNNLQCWLSSQALGSLQKSTFCSFIHIKYFNTTWTYVVLSSLTQHRHIKGRNRRGGKGTKNRLLNNLFPICSHKCRKELLKQHYTWSKGL